MPDGWDWHLKGGWLHDTVGQGTLLTSDNGRVGLAVIVGGMSHAGVLVGVSPSAVSGTGAITEVADILIGDLTDQVGSAVPAG